MREFGQDYLFRVSIEPKGGYKAFQVRKKPYYVVAQDKERAKKLVNLKSGWIIKSVSELAKQYSNTLFGSN